MDESRRYFMVVICDSLEGTDAKLVGAVNAALSESKTAGVAEVQPIRSDGRVFVHASFDESELDDLGDTDGN